MFLSFIKKVIGTRNDRELKRIQTTVELVNELEEEIKKLTDDQLRNR